LLTFTPQNVWKTIDWYLFHLIELIQRETYLTLFLNRLMFVREPFVALWCCCCFYFIL